MKCKLIGAEGKGINAHIIPKRFYSIDPEESLPTEILTNKEGNYPKRSPIGIYDDSVVTEEGERVFSKLDDYGAELLLDRKAEFQEIWHNGRLVAYQRAEYDYDLLKLFVL